MVKVSVVTATYCERENLPVLVARLRSALASYEHEIIVVDDSSPDGTYEVALEHADKAIKVEGFGQTRSLLEGIRAANHEIVATIDADLENPPELLPLMLKTFLNEGVDLLVASRVELPRVSERIASATLGKLFGVRDVFSNYRVYRRSLFTGHELTLGETFGGELLLYAWAMGYRIRELTYAPPPRRPDPRIGGRLKANLRILSASSKLLGLALKWKFLSCMRTSGRKAPPSC
ncbi:MAG: glycosyltransferase family 2 protein [Thermofilaceae archaeon]|nr:glycosyltransferase family 2 protein [Thermofilaceae archaeon]MCX8179901.1 glycosyltransferase family 2 protein [Thermofilaceae archaeon]MDW8004408.1 glycosyltransferase family 2 protein [Thermofilaceae archaeon]